MLYRRPVLRPVTCSTRKESSRIPCSGEPRSTRTSGLPILTRAAGGTDRFSVPDIAHHLPPFTVPRAGRGARGIGHLTVPPGGGAAGEGRRTSSEATIASVPARVTAACWHREKEDCRAGRRDRRDAHREPVAAHARP